MVLSKLLCGLTDLLASIVLHVSAKNCCLAIEQVGQLPKFAYVLLTPLNLSNPAKMHVLAPKVIQTVLSTPP